MFELFYALVIGLSVLTSLYALVMTKGQTVLAVLPLLVLGPLWFWRQGPELAPVPAVASPPIRWMDLLVIAAGTVVIALVRHVLTQSAPRGQVLTASQDYVFYSKTSYAFNMKGVEYPFINALAQGPLNPQAYHYLDLWGSALLVRLTGIPAMVVLNSVVYSLLLAIVFVGFAAVYERCLTRRGVVFALALLSVFTCGVYLSVFQQVPLLQGTAIMNEYTMPLLRPKIVPIIIFLLLGYGFLVKGRVVAASWVWSALALVYTVVAPAAYLGGGAFVFYLLVRKRISFPKAVQSLAAYGLAAIYIGAFYWIPSHLHPAEQSYSLSYLQYLPRLHDMRTVVNSFIGTLLAQAAYYGLYLLIIGVLFFRRQAGGRWLEYEGVLASALIFMVVSAAIGAVFLRATDGYQLGINLLLPVIIVGVALLLGAALLHRGPRYQVFALAALGCLLCYNTREMLQSPYDFFTGTRHDAGFVRQVWALSPRLSRHGALLLDRHEYTATHALNSDISTVGMYMGLVRDNTLLLSLSVAQFDHSLQAFKHDTAFASYLVGSAPFTQFVRKQRLHHVFASMPKAQRAFLLANGINFICASPSARLPQQLQQLVARTLVDPVSKQTMYVLNVPLRPASQPVREQLVDYVW